MIAQFILTAMLAGIVLYAWAQYRQSPVVGLLASGAAAVGIYFVWMPSHASELAAIVGIGRGADLVLYVWVVISLLILLNLHLKLTSQLDLITALARKIAIDEVSGIKLLNNNVHSLSGQVEKKVYGRLGDKSGRETKRRA
jgi:hypothetical protein